MGYQQIIEALEVVKIEAPLKWAEKSELDRAIRILKDLEPRRAEIEQNKVLAAQPLTANERIVMYYYAAMNGIPKSLYVSPEKHLAEAFAMTQEEALAVITSLAEKKMILVSTYRHEIWDIVIGNEEEFRINLNDPVALIWRKNNVQPPTKKQTSANNPLVKFARKHWRKKFADEYVLLIQKGVPADVMKRYMLAHISKQWYSESYAELEALQV